MIINNIALMNICDNGSMLFLYGCQNQEFQTNIRQNLSVFIFMIKSDSFI